MEVVSQLVLAIHLSTTGFGWVVFEDTIPVDWGLATAKVDKNTACLKRLRTLLNQYEPAVLVLEEFEHGYTRRHARIQRLYRSLMVLAKMRRVPVCVITRSQVRSCFRKTSATTRYKIAQAIAMQLPELRSRLPQIRRPWMSEDSRMSLFAATALAITHLSRESFEERRKNMSGE